MASDEPSDEAPVCAECGNDFYWNENTDRDNQNPFCNQCAHVVAGRAVTLQRELDEARAEARRARQENAVDGYHAELMRIKAALRAAESENTRLRGHQFQAAIDACRQKQHSARRAGDYARGSTGIDLTVHDDAADAFERVANWLASRSAQPDPERWLGEDGDPLRLAAPEYTEPTRPDPEREARRRLGG